MEIRSNELADTIISRVKFTFTENYLFYRILFTKDDTGYWKNIIYSPSA